MTLINKAKQLHDQGFSVIPTNIRKAPAIGTGWQQYIDDNRIEPNGNFAQANVKGVGVVLGAKIGDHYLAAIDVDCYNKTVSRMMCDYIAKQSQTGTIAYRVGQPPKFLVPYLSPTQVKKTVSSSFNSGEEKDSKIERLGKGQQFVAYGKQENGEYKWYNGDLDINALPVFDEIDIAEMFVTFEQLAAKYGMAQTDHKAINPFEADDIDPFATVAKPPLDIDTAQVKATLQSIDPAALDYQEWVNVGMALHHQFGGDVAAYQMWDSWSQRDKARYKGEEMRFKWGSFGNNERTVTFATVIAMAKKLSAQPSLDDIKPTPPKTQAFAEPVTDEMFAIQRKRQWAIKNIFQKKKLVALYGAPKTLKSFVVLDMALSIATGLEWCGNRTSKMNILYVAGEGHDGVLERVLAWKLAHPGLDTSGLEITYTNVLLMDKDERKRLYDYMSVKKFGMVIFDTYARMLGGEIDEDGNSASSRAIRVFDDMITRFDCTVMVVHHTPKSDPTIMRGAGALAGAVDNAFYTTKTDAGVVLTSALAKSEEPFEPIGLALVRQDLPTDAYAQDDEDDNEPVKSAYVRFDPTIANEKNGPFKLKKDGQLLLECIKYMEQNEPVSKCGLPKEMIIDGGGFGFYGDAIDVEMTREYFYKRNGADKESTNRSAFNRAIKQLEESGLVKRFDGVFAVSVDVK